MLDAFINWLISALVVIAVAYVLPGVSVASFWVALVAALILGLVNAVVRPIAVALTLPLTVMTLGFFLFVINAVMILIVAAVVPGFSVASFWWALLFSLILSLANGLVRPVRR